MKVTNKLYFLKDKSLNKLYGIYISMINRCTNVKCKSYANYGGRGIKVCDEWMKDFNSFVNWSLQHGYINQDNVKRSNRLSIDRIDNDKGYCPENCQWITLKENILKSRIGKHWSESTKKKISVAHKGKKLSTEQKLKLSLSHKGKAIGNKNALKGVYKMVDKNSGEIIEIFEGNKQIVSYFKKRNLKYNLSNINMCAQGKRKSACGYKWIYERIR